MTFQLMCSGRGNLQLNLFMISFYSFWILKSWSVRVLFESQFSLFSLIEEIFSIQYISQSGLQIASSKSTFKLQKVDMIECKLNLKSLLFIMTLLLLILPIRCVEERDDDLDDLKYSNSPSLQEKDEEGESQDDSFESNDKLRHTADMDDFQEVQEEVDHLIGFEHEETDKEGHVLHPADMTNLKMVFHNNKKWCKDKLEKDPHFFKRHEETQKPNYLWIGCSDSRLPANQILGLDYGEVFVLRNVANMVSPSDISVLAVIQYAVEVLKVKDIIVAGHYGCGGVKAAVTKYNHGPLEAWLSRLRRIRHKHSHAFSHLQTLDEKAQLLVEINVKEQVFNVASTPFVQEAWMNGQELRVHGVVFDMETGRLIDLHVTMHCIEQVPEELAVFEK